MPDMYLVFARLGESAVNLARYFIESLESRTRFAIVTVRAIILRPRVDAQVVG